jgi:hypothetical protein
MQSEWISRGPTAALISAPHVRVDLTLETRCVGDHFERGGWGLAAQASAYYRGRRGRADMSRVPAFRRAAVATDSLQWRYWILRDHRSCWTEGSFYSYAGDEAGQAGRKPLQELEQQRVAISEVSCR